MNRIIENYSLLIYSKMTPMAKISSGIKELDNLLFGGLPKGRCYLLSGEPGVGKTILTLQYLLHGAKNNENCAYISIDEKPEHVLSDAQSLEWELDPYLTNKTLQFLDFSEFFGQLHLDKQNSINRIIDTIETFIQKNNISRLVIDPIAPIIFSEQSPLPVIEYIRRLIFTLENHTECTTLVTSLIPVGSNTLSQHGIEEFASSGIILLRLQKEKNNYIRTLRLRKMRGTQIDLSEYTFDILPKRGIVLRQAL